MTSNSSSNDNDSSLLSTILDNKQKRINCNKNVAVEKSVTASTITSGNRRIEEENFPSEEDDEDEEEEDEYEYEMSEQMESGSFRLKMPCATDSSTSSRRRNANRRPIDRLKPLLPYSLYSDSLNSHVHEAFIGRTWIFKQIDRVRYINRSLI